MDQWLDSEQNSDHEDELLLQQQQQQHEANVAYLRFVLSRQLEVAPFSADLSEIIDHYSIVAQQSGWEEVDRLAHARFAVRLFDKFRTLSEQSLERAESSSAVGATRASSSVGIMTLGVGTVSALDAK